MAKTTTAQKTQVKDDVFGVLLHVSKRDVKNHTTQFGYLIRPFGKGQKAAWYNTATQSDAGRKYLSSFEVGSYVGLTLNHDSDFDNDIDRIHPAGKKSANK